MIATIVSGGIGNQLFMYAAARALSLRQNTDLVLNIEKGFRDDYTYKRNFELNVFKLKYHQDAILTFDTFLGKIIYKVSRIFGRNILRPSYKLLHDTTDNKGVDERFFKCDDSDYFLDGYWQSEMYFKDYENVIRDDLVFSFDKSGVLQNEEYQIFSQSGKIPVCMGVRRYQECTGPLSFSITDEEYYIKAMDYMCAQLHDPVFYVFTQDKDWVLSKLNIDGKYDIRFVVDKENATIEDLYLMSRFKYHIISNSSFYWWGAWLANGDIVISNSNFVNKKSNCSLWTII